MRNSAVQPLLAVGVTTGKLGQKKYDATAANYNEQQLDQGSASSIGFAARRDVEKRKVIPGKYGFQSAFSVTAHANEV